MSIGAVILALLLCLTGCGNAAATYTQYVQAIMDCTYHAQTEEYIRLTGVPEEEALAVHETQVQRTAELMCMKMSVKLGMLSEKTAEGYTALAEALLAQVRYSVESAVKSEGDFRVSVTAEPIVFWETALPEVEQLYENDFAERFARAEGNDLRLSRLEEEWGRRVLEILNGCAAETAYKEPVGTLVVITGNADGRYAVPESAWLRLDALLLGINT